MVYVPVIIESTVSDLSVQYLRVAFCWWVILFTLGVILFNPSLLISLNRQGTPVE